jgi:hypothetical protein
MLDALRGRLVLLLLVDPCGLRGVFALGTSLLSLLLLLLLLLPLLSVASVVVGVGVVEGVLHSRGDGVEADRGERGEGREDEEEGGASDDVGETAATPLGRRASTVRHGDTMLAIRREPLKRPTFRAPERELHVRTIFSGRV